MSSMFETQSQYRTKLLSQYLKYMENVLDNSWEEMESLSDQIPPSLLKWCSTEYYIGRHSDSYVDFWVTQNGPFPDFDPGDWSLFQEHVQTSAFPGIDILVSLKTEWEWIEVSSEDKSTIMRDISLWLEKEEDVNENGKSDSLLLKYDISNAILT